mmetsp:Transcript_9860/g.32656  ORF Transcript_9860/g.32656 Transcript_9860/m.32656 type:complete len:288 (+) Transcript_9860:233-1096(+)
MAWRPPPPRGKTQSPLPPAASPPRCKRWPGRPASWQTGRPVPHGQRRCWSRCSPSCARADCVRMKRTSRAAWTRCAARPRPSVRGAMSSPRRCLLPRTNWRSRLRSSGTLARRCRWRRPSWTRSTPRGGGAGRRCSRALRSSGPPTTRGPIAGRACSACSRGKPPMRGRSSVRLTRAWCRCRWGRVLRSSHRPGLNSVRSGRSPPRRRSVRAPSLDCRLSPLENGPSATPRRRRRPPCGASWRRWRLWLLVPRLPRRRIRTGWSSRTKWRCSRRLSRARPMRQSRPV